MKKFLVLVISLLFSALVLSACASQRDIINQNDIAKPSTYLNPDSILDNLGQQMQSEIISMPVMEISLNRVCNSKDGLFLQGYNNTNKNASVYKFNRDENQILEYVNLGQMDVVDLSSPDGLTLCVLSVSILEKNSDTEEVLYSITSISSNGSLVSMELPPELYQETYIHGFEATRSGYVLQTSDGIICVDNTGNMLDTLDSFVENTEIIRISPETLLLCSSYEAPFSSESSTAKQTIFTEMGENFALGDTYTSEIAFSAFYPYTDDCILVTLKNTIYEYNYKTNEYNALINAVTSGMDVSRFAYAGLDQFFTIEKGLPVIWCFAKGGEVENLRLATYNISPQLQVAVETFNSRNKNYVIEIIDYAAYDNIANGAGLDRLATDITSGNVPDIYDLNYFNTSKLVANGLLQDLKPFFDADPDISYEDILPGVAKCTEYSGGSYELIPSFSIVTLCGDASMVGTNLSIESFLELTNDYSPVELFGPDMTKGEFLNYVLCFMKEDLYSEQTLECNFTSEDFISMLEFIALLPTDFSFDGSQGDPLARVYTGEQKLLMAYLTHGIMSYIACCDSAFSGEAQFIGFPSNSGSGFGILPGLRLGMSSNSPHKDGVWEFFKMFLSEDSQFHSRILPGFPVITSILEKSLVAWVESAASKTLKISTSSLAGPVVIEGTIDETTVPKRIINMLENLDCIVVCDSAIYDIVMQSSSAFFSGAKSAEETAALIQSKVRIYLAEQYS